MNRWRSGSISEKRRSAGSPPTLWCVLIFCAGLRLGCLGFDDVGIERPLRQEIDPTELRRFFLEDADELVADDLAFLLGLLDAGQSGEEPLARVDHDEPHAQVLLERHPQQLRLALAHQAVIDVDARQPVAHGAMDERSGNGRIDPATEGADHETVGSGGRAWSSTRCADRGNRRLDEVGRRPRRARAGDVEDEVPKDVPTARRVDHLGVELDAVQATIEVDEAGELRRVGLGRGLKAGRGRRIESPWLIQTGCSRSSPRNRPSSEVKVTRGRSVLAARGRNDVAAELDRHQLQPVADPEDRDAARPQPGIGLRSALVIHAGRAAREDDGLRLPAANLVERSVERQQLRVDVELANAAGDQLRVLAPEVENDDGVGLRNRASLDGHASDAVYRRAAQTGALSAVSR